MSVPVHRPQSECVRPPGFVLVLFTLLFLVLLFPSPSEMHC